MNSIKIEFFPASETTTTTIIIVSIASIDSINVPITYIYECMFLLTKILPKLIVQYNKPTNNSSSEKQEESVTDMVESV